MVLKKIALVVHDNGTSLGSRHTPCATTASTKLKYWQVSSQDALNSLLRKYQVDALVDVEYACEVHNYAALQDGGKYTLGESGESVELQPVPK